MPTTLTSKQFKQLKTAAENAVSKAGAGAMRGFLLIEALAEAGIDLTISEPEPRPALNLTMPDPMQDNNTKAGEG